MLFCGDTFLFSKNAENPFRHMLGFFQGQTICLNLETSLKSTEQADKNICLSVEKKNFAYLPDSVCVVSLVNNHVRDSGDPSNFVETLKQHNMVVIGPSNPAQNRSKISGMEIDFFSAYFRLPRFRFSYNGKQADILEQIIRESNAQRKIVNLHWGYEHISTPAPFQQELAKRFIDAGASIIIGHHPHVPQGMECYRGKYIFYSLGNFNFWQFDTSPSEDNKWGCMVDYNLLSGEVKTIPYQINENYQPYLVTQEANKILLGKIKRLSASLQSINEEEWFTTAYAHWYKHETSVWKRRCFKNRSPQLWLKFLIWMCMPLQIKYHAYAIKKAIRQNKHDFVK